MVCELISRQCNSGRCMLDCLTSTWNAQITLHQSLGINYWKHHVIVYIQNCFRIIYVIIVCPMVTANKRKIKESHPFSTDWKRGCPCLGCLLGSAKWERLKGRNGSLSKIFADSCRFGPWSAVWVVWSRRKLQKTAGNRRKPQKIAGSSFDPFLPFSLSQ